MTTPLRILWSSKVRERFLAFTEQRGNCLEWTGTAKKGYGQFWLYGKFERAPRVAYAIYHDLSMDDVPEVVRHSCDNPPCVSDGHLLGGTQLDNMRDAAERGHRSHLGNPTPRTEATRAKQSAVLTGRKHPLGCGHCVLMRTAHPRGMQGKIQTEETRAKMRAAHAAKRVAA